MRPATQFPCINEVVKVTYLSTMNLLDFDASALNSPRSVLYESSNFSLVDGSMNTE